MSAGRVVTGLATVLLLASCGDAPSVDGASVEDYLTRTQAAAFPAGSQVEGADCPSGAELADVVELRCTLSVSGTEVPYRVRLSNADGDFVGIDAEPAAFVIPADAVRTYLADSLADEARNGVTVDCDDGSFLVAQAGEEIACRVAVGAQAHEVRLVLDDRGRVSVRR